jgi:putative transcriptional regulator
MVNHHPDTRLLNEFASGALPLAQSLCVSLHLKYCDRCQRNNQRLHHLGGAMFDSLTPQAVDKKLLDSVFSRLDEEPPLAFTPAEKTDNNFPVLVQRLMSREYKDLDWKRVNRDLRISRLRTGDPDNEFALYHIKAGGKIPQHSHRGTELTLVLEGSFSDEEGIYLEGDFLIRDGDDVHTPTASKSADCVCIGVLDAPISFTRWNYRPLNRFLKLEAH